LYVEFVTSASTGQSYCHGLCNAAREYAIYLVAAQTAPT